MDKKLWIIEMGESGRPDYIDDIYRILGKQIVVNEIGILDDLSTSDIEKMKAENKDRQIISLMRDKRQIVLNSERVEERIRELILTIKSNKGDAILVACDEDYSPVFSKSFVFFPSQIFFNAISSVIENKRIAVVLPVKEQVHRLGKKWEDISESVTFVVASPFDNALIMTEIRKLKTDSLDAIVLDCMGFRFEHKEEIESITGLPCFVPRILVLGTMITLL